MDPWWIHVDRWYDGSIVDPLWIHVDLRLQEELKKNGGERGKDRSVYMVMVNKKYLT